MSYVLYFSKPFALAIAIWPFLSLLLTLPVLALLYHRDNRLRFTSALTAYLVVLYLIALACFTMYPMPFLVWMNSRSPIRSSFFRNLVMFTYNAFSST